MYLIVCVKVRCELVMKFNTTLIMLDLSLEIKSNNPVHEHNKTHVVYKYCRSIVIVLV